MTKNTRDATFGSRESASQQLPKSLQLDTGTRYMPGKTAAAHTYVTLWQRKHVISGVKTYYSFNRNINCFVSRTMRTVSHQLLNMLALGKLNGEGMNHDHVSAIEAPTIAIQLQ